MKVRCTRESLLAALQSASAVVPARSPKPVLTNVKLEAASGSAVLSATDLEVGIRTEIEGVETSAPGAVLLPSARLSAIVRESAPVIISTQYQPDGTTREIAKSNPADAMLRSWLDKCRALENDLVLNPATLLRVPVEQPREIDPFDDEPSA